MEGGHYLNSGVLFKVARTAYQHTKSAESDRASNQDDALVAILFSAATLEALIMELAHMAEVASALYGNQQLGSLASILEEAEAARGSTRLKFLLTKAILSATSYNKGALPYQDFETLFAIRDAIIHLKPESMADEQKTLDRLRAKKICAEKIPDQTSSWLADICTRATARWACNVVAHMVKSLKECLPTDDTRTVVMMNIFLTQRFDAVD